MENSSTSYPARNISRTLLDLFGADFFTTPAYQMILVISINAVIFLLGVAGNITVAIVLIKNKVLFEPTGTFLLSLAVADLILLLVAQPIAVMEFYTKEIWYLGPALCKVVPFVENAASNASVLTILAISLERYLAICHPLKAQYVCTESRAVKIALLVWFASIAIAIPLPVFSYYKFSEFYDGSRVPVCAVRATGQSRRVYIIVMTLAFYIIPTFVYLIVYTSVIRRLSSDDDSLSQAQKRRMHHVLQTRRQLVYMLVAIIAAFIVCVLPFRVMSLWFIYTDKAEVLALGTENYNYLREIPRILIYFNSAVNPIVYNLVSSKFRLALHRTCRRRQRNNAHSNHHTRLLQSTSLRQNSSKN